MKKESITNLLTRRIDRDYSIDVVKTILIFSVVWGHAIQYLHGTEFDFWADPIFKFIYGFHMPLFALISGYLACGSFKKYNTKALINKRAKQLLIPTIGWAFVLTVLDAFLNLLTHDDSSLQWIIGRLLSRTINDLWFLKAIFISLVLVILVEKYLHGHWISYVFFSLLTLFLPNNYNLALYGFVFPFFVMGFKVSTILKRWNDSFSKNMKIGLFTTSLIMYCILLLFFNKNDYIYTTGLSIINTKMTLTSQLIIDFYRMIVAIVGCIMLLEGSALITYVNDLIVDLSSKTMIIYIVTASLFIYISQLMSKIEIKIILSSMPVVIMDILILIPISIILIFIALLFEKIIKKIRLETILLGK